jgi:hypothetical protein
MTTLLSKLVIDITALPSREQAPTMYFRRYQYTVVYRIYPTVSARTVKSMMHPSCGAANFGGSRPFQAALPDALQ